MKKGISSASRTPCRRLNYLLRRREISRSILLTDASSVGPGACFTQVFNGEEFIISFAIHRFSKLHANEGFAESQCLSSILSETTDSILQADVSRSSSTTPTHEALS